MLADHHIRVGVGQHMIGANVGGVVKPEPRHLRQHLPLERDRGQDPVKRRNPVGRDQNPPRGLIRGGGQIVAIAHLAEIGVRQFGNAGVVKNAGKIGHGLAPNAATMLLCLSRAGGPDVNPAAQDQFIQSGRGSPKIDGS